MKLKFMNIWLCNVDDRPTFAFGILTEGSPKGIYDEMCLRILIHKKSYVSQAPQHFKSLSNNKPIK